MQKKPIIIIVALILVCALVITGVHMLSYWNLLPEKSYTAADFNIETIYAETDFNGNGTDDYSDFVLGARADAKQKPTYDPRYWGDGGYPPEDIGVCTDVIWRAFRQAGYSLRDMVDADIRENVDLYPRVEGKPDLNIDFRRVVNLEVYFKRHAIALTLDPAKIEEWQPGDIVIYSVGHIGIVSDRRNADGMPYLIHNGGQPVREEDALTRREISGHYRFDASLLSEDLLLPFA